MILIPVLLMIMACLIFYSTSKRAVYKRRPLNNWFLKRRLLSRMQSMMLLMFGFILFINLQGVGVGIFLGLVTLMTIYGVMVLFIPLGSRTKA